MVEERGRKSSHINAIASLPLTFSPSETVQGDFFNSPSPILQCQNDKRPTSHPEALLDVGFYGTAALVGTPLHCFISVLKRVGGVGG